MPPSVANTSAGTITKLQNATSRDPGAWAHQQIAEVAKGDGGRHVDAAIGGGQNGGEGPGLGLAGQENDSRLCHGSDLAPATGANTLAAMATIEIYTSPYCGYCHRAKQLLSRKGAAFTEYDVMVDAAKRDEMMTRALGRHTVPQIFIDGRHIGGCDELHALDAQGGLDPLLAKGL